MTTSGRRGKIAPFQERCALSQTEPHVDRPRSPLEPPVAATVFQPTRTVGRRRRAWIPRFYDWLLPPRVEHRGTVWLLTIIAINTALLAAISALIGHGIPTVDGWLWWL